ncbi:DUF998 domain-containing protein [Micromonospora sp. MA102]|uniref:DUF998 domain-containing protein n=1 Tax=Micromonospora sp. MA102 TaxID=2952755 RepID=UPI0021C71897|nr:DUF998 domain-containing protein [Micromonospora sp. MA102]
MPGTRSSGLLALGGIALAAVLTVVGHLEVNDNLNPWSLTVSDFAVSDRGGVIDTAMAVLAAATLVLLPALRRAGAGRLAGALLVAWSAGLMAAAVVPTNEPGLPMDAAAYVHRYASVVAFLALPVAGWLLARRLGGRAARWVRGLALTSLVLAAAMVWSAYPGDRLLIGLAERLLILTEVALLAVVAGTLVRRETGEVAVPRLREHPHLAELAVPARQREVTPARGA